ncbi:hypothetical protein [Amycolatopsis sp. cmx-11-51]|uniref:hypothetical protein n=1 Tax=Amycolatopsis sp. cmx-11-51 TaxID=2785797 RepID=UPI0039E4E95B
MAIPGTPLPVLAGLLVILTMAGGPFRTAQLALLPDVLEGEWYVAGSRFARSPSHRHSWSDSAVVDWSSTR